MKKLKLFISLWFTMFSIVMFGQAEYEKIAITANVQDNSALKVNVQSSSNEINWKYIKDFQKEKEYLSTGLIKSGVISINGDNTKYNISAGIGIITNFDDPENPTSTIVNFPAVVAKTPSYLTTSNITYVAINSSGTVTESATPFTPEQRRSLIILGAVIHSNLTNINVVNNISAPTNASTNQLHDFMEAIGALNLSGNKFTPNNGNLSLNKTSGTIFKLGSNFVNDWKNPHVLGQAALTALTFRYRTQNGTEGSDVTSINPNVYDLNNVLTAVPSNRFSIQTITLFQSGLVRIQYGQNTYATLSEAEAAISTRSYNVESNIALNGITRAYLLVKEGTTALSNPSDAKLVEAGKFGNVSSSGGAITFASVVAALGYTPENVANKQNSLTTDGSGVKYPTVDAVNTKVSNIDNTSDLNKPISTATQTALNLKENTANKNTANGYAGLGSDGKLISSQLPAITITDTFVVGSQALMLALTAETGDVAVRTDVNKSFILKGTNATILSDWQELLTPTSSVTSVFGRNGAVTANTGDYTADQINETASRKFQTLAQQTYNDATSSIQSQLNSKANDNTVVHLAGSESITGAKTFTATPSFDSNIYLKQLSSWVNPAGYTVIGGRTDGFLVSASATKSALIGLGNLTQAWTYDFPNKSGTFAMTSDVPSISGAANYVSKFTGASTLGNSQIFDNGTNVGIGTATPSEKLEVNGNIKFGDASFNSTLNQAGIARITSTFTDQSNVQFYGHTGGSANNLIMTLRGAGNVGINETAPNSKLTIKDDIKGIDSKGSFAIENTSFFKSLYMGVSNFGQFNPFIQATSRNDMSPSPLLINPNGGNVGIGTGTTAPSGLLNVGSSASFHFTESGMGSMMLKATSGTARSLFEVHSADGSVKSMFQSVNGNGLILGTITNNDVIFYTNTTEKARVTSGGNLLLGTTSGTGKMRIDADGSVQDILQLRTLYALTGSRLISFVNSGGSEIGSVMQSTGSTVSYNVTSDYRLKEDLKSFNGLDLISKIRIYDYKWKGYDERSFGVLAHELQETIPSAVSGEKDGKNMQQVDYSKLVPILVQSIQELQKEIDILKNK